MLTAVGLVPGAPLLVPELSGSRSPDVDAVRAATLEIGQFLADRADRWTILSATSTTSSKGTFRGFGADVQVSLVPHDASNADPSMPLPLLIGAWLRTASAPGVTARHYRVPGDVGAGGAELLRTLDNTPEREALLVVADGSTMLTPKAPGAFHPDAPAFQDRLDVAVEQGRWADVLGLEGWERFGAGDSRAFYQVMATVLQSMQPSHTRGTRLAPFGVGYHMRGWSV